MRLSFVRAFAALAALLSIRGVPLAAQLVPIHPDDVVGKTPAEVLVVPEVHSMYGSGVFTWRNSVLGGAAAAALLVGSVVAYLMMWTLGVGTGRISRDAGHSGEGERRAAGRIRESY